MKTIIAVFGLSALLLSMGPVAMAQTEEPTLSGESLRTVEGRSLSPDDYEHYLWEPDANGRPVAEGIKRYQLRRQRQETIEIIPGVNIPANAVENQGTENEVLPKDRGDKSGRPFRLPLGSF
jgi:hypothetical protein